MEAKQIIRGVVCVGSTRMSSAIARRRGGESTTTLGSEGKHQAGYAKAKARNAVEAYTLHCSGGSQKDEERG